jgi:hypothetical protein
MAALGFLFQVTPVPWVAMLIVMAVLTLRIRMGMSVVAHVQLLQSWTRKYLPQAPGMHRHCRHLS